MNFSFKNSLRTYSNLLLINSYTNMNNVTHVLILLSLYACHGNKLYFEYLASD
jgi:hypothetical protein